MNPDMPESPQDEPYLWRNPQAVWGARGGNHEVPSIHAPDPRTVWDENPAYKVRLHKVGRLKHYVIWPANAGRLWRRWQHRLGAGGLADQLAGQRSSQRPRVD